MKHPIERPQQPSRPRDSGSWPRPTLLALIVVAALLAAAGIGRAYAMNTQQAGIDADALRDFEEVLVQAFIDNDTAVLSDALAPQFRYADWEGERRVVQPDEVTDLVDSILVGPASAPIYLDEIGMDEIEAIVGDDPLILWGEDLPVVSVLLISGLTESGGGEALLAIAPDEEGNPTWAGMLVAEDGLPAAPAPEGTDTSETDEAAAAEDNAIDTTEEETTAEEALDEEALDEEAPPEQEAEEIAAPEAERITLDGAPTIGTRTGVLDGIAPVVFLLRAEAGQALTIDLSATEDDVNFSVVGERNRQPYKSLDNPARIWTLTVPASQDYRIQVESETPAEFVLTLLVSPIGHRLPTATPSADDAIAEAETTPEPATATEASSASTPVSTPELIRFGFGETAATRTGVIVQGERMEYLLRVSTGQTLNVDIASDGDYANFAITGVSDGQPYKRLENEDRAFSFVVPTTQDYRITVATAAPEGEETYFTLFVDVPPAAASPTPVPDWPPIDPVSNPARLQVPLGETSVSVTDILRTYGADGYLLEAQAGQRMIVTVTSPDDIARFSVSGYDDGIVLKPLDDQSTWQGILPSTQDYLVQVENPRSVRVQYTLHVEFSPLAGVPPTNPVPTSVPPAMPTVEPQRPAQRIDFPPGAISASVDGFIAPNETQTYVLAASAGQSMTAVISSPRNDVGLSIVGADGTPYKRASVGGSGFSFTLPLTQDYYVSAIGLGGATTYSLSVIIVN